MAPLRRALSFAIVLSGVAVLAGAAVTALARSPAPDRIRDAHDVHRQNDLACEVCHEPAAASKSGTDNLLPTHEVCATCHEVEDNAECGMCHSDTTAPRAAAHVTTVVQKFSHAAHVAKGIECATCHLDAAATAGDFAAVGDDAAARSDAAAGKPHLPSMASCRTCHATASQLSDCALCHASSEPLRPASHTTGWASFHGASARLDQASCESCHTTTDCQQCHAGDNVRPRVHPLGFAFNHALAARGNEASCATCHEDRSSCTSCHAAERVLPQNHSRANWVSVRGGGRHAEEGQFDLESCMACHDTGAEATTCVPCHGR